MGRASRALAAAAVAAAIALACQTGYYQEYRAAHPGFDATLPRAGATLPELLAALHAPVHAPKAEVALSKVTIYRADPERWREIPFEAIRRGEVAAKESDDYAVLVAWTCHFEEGLQKGDTGRGGFYLLEHNRLAAWDHHEFRERCNSDNDFRAARGALIATELQASDRLRALGVRYSLVQAYQHGLAYVEAGRLEDARAMLEYSERVYRPALAKARTEKDKQSLADAERLRAALMRALGVEAVTKP